ncbi:MAG TPA: hypothetical protein VFC92_14160 [Bacteroidales bacterium]|nr:hypothetical protein [Bacteroidales bacterium]
MNKASPSVVAVAAVTLVAERSRIQPVEAIRKVTQCYTKFYTE